MSANLNELKQCCKVVEHGITGMFTIVTFYKYTFLNISKVGKQVVGVSEKSLLYRILAKNPLFNNPWLLLSDLPLTFPLLKVECCSTVSLLYLLKRVTEISLKALRNTDNL